MAEGLKNGDIPVLYEEKQYLGYNRFSVIRRMVLAIFCFSVYFYSNEKPEAGVQATAELLFYLGIGILIVSFLLIFVLHLHTKVIPNGIILDGLWTARRVKIDLNSIVEVKLGAPSRYRLSQPIYNLHRKGRIRFFTRGDQAVHLTDRDGLVYIIGSQRVEELLRVVQEQIEGQK
ncbi:MAG: hypothetical protein ACFB10_20925 [Salibacteraceae bacterium]